MISQDQDGNGEAVSEAQLSRLRLIEGHIRAALALADEGDDPLLAVRLCTCLGHVTKALPDSNAED